MSHPLYGIVSHLNSLTLSRKSMPIFLYLRYSLRKRINWTNTISPINSLVIPWTCDVKMVTVLRLRILHCITVNFYDLHSMI